MTWRNATILALWDLFKLWNKIEFAIATFKVIRGYRRWTRVPLKQREQLLWTKFIYEIVSGYGEGETKHLFEEVGQHYPDWGTPVSRWGEQ